MFFRRRNPRTSIHVPLAGLIFVGVSGFVLLAAINSSQNLLYMAFGALMGCMAVSLRVVIRNLRRLTIERVVDQHLVANEPTLITYRITNHKYFFPLFDIRITEANFKGPLAYVPEAYCLQVTAGRTAVTSSYITATHRGIVELQDIKLTTAFPFGFLLRFIHVPAPATLVVYPRIGILNRKLLLHSRDQALQSALSSHARGECDEFYGLREYRPGDSTRSIHWRRTARTGELVVKEMAASVNPQIVVTLDLREHQRLRDVDRAERAIEVAAAIIAQAATENFAIGLYLVGAEDLSLAVPRSGREQRYLLLGALATIDLDKPINANVLYPRGTVKSAAQWILVTLSQSLLDPPVPPHATVTVLNLDTPDSVGWVQFTNTPAGV